MFVRLLVSAQVPFCYNTTAFTGYFFTSFSVVFFLVGFIILMYDFLPFLVKTFSAVQCSVVFIALLEGRCIHFFLTSSANSKVHFTVIRCHPFKGLSLKTDLKAFNHQRRSVRVESVSVAK